ncbi:cell division protein PerM [Rhodococcus sp. NPDC003322]
MNSALSRAATRPDGQRRTPRPPIRKPATGTRPSPTPEQVRALLGLGLRPALLALVVIATCMLVTLVAANSDLTGTSGAIAAGWLAVHQVPLTIGGASLGVLPLLPTLVMVAAVARGCSRVVHASTPRHECWWVLGAAVAGPLVVTAIALAVVADAASVIALSTPNPLSAFAWVAAVHLTGAGIGIGMRLWRPAVTFLGVPDWVLAAARPAMRAAMALLATGAAITVASLLASWSTVGMLVEAGDGFTGGLGLTLLSILYLPNVVVGATAVLVGSAVHVGSASVSLFDVVGGPVPALPVLGALPEQSWGDGWLAALVIPAAIGVLFGRECARRSGSPLLAAKTALVGAFAVAVVFAVLGFVAGGALGSFGSVGVTVATFAGATFGWLALCGAAAAAVTRWRARPEPEPEPAPERAPRPPRPNVVPETPALPGGRIADGTAAAESEAGGGEVPPPSEAPGPGDGTDAPDGAAPRTAVIEAELLEDAETAPPVVDIEPGSVVDAEVVDEPGDTGATEAGVVQVTEPKPEEDLPEGTRTSSD